jgi:hypothetical protein
MTININEDFNWEQYVENYTDLQETGVDTREKAWQHWLNHGEKEGRTYLELETENIQMTININEDFNWEQYVENYTDLQETGVDTREKAWHHWLNHGEKEGRVFHNFYEDEIKESYNNKIELINYNNINIIFKPKYDRYGTHYFGWKGVINNFIDWFCENNKNKTFKYNIFFDEWIEKLLIWGNKIINEKYLNEIKKNNYKLITFIHNPPFLELKDKKYRSKISNEIIINDTTHFNENLFYEMEKNNIIDQIAFIYVLSNHHKEYMYYNYPKLQTKILSVHHAMNLETEESTCFDIEQFLYNKKIYNIGWWLRNFKTFIDFVPPKNYKKHILVKNDFVVPFNNNIVPNNDMSSVEIINEITNEEYGNIFKNSCIFADIVDCIANNTILECIKFNTPIIVRRSKSAEEYLGVNYPLFFTDYNELVVLKEESFLLDLIFESHFYLKNMNKSHIEIHNFNKKINYDLNKLIENNNKEKLTWCCFIDAENCILLDNLIDSYILQDDLNSIKLLIITNNLDNDSTCIKNIESYMNLYNIFHICLDYDYVLSDNQKLYFSVKNINTQYLTIVNPKDNYHNSYSKICIDKLDFEPNCDITCSSYNLFDKSNNIFEQIIKKNTLLNKSIISKNIIDNRGITLRKDLYYIIEPFDNLEEIEDNNYNFWIKCVENNMNMICISEIPLLSINI